MKKLPYGKFGRCTNNRKRYTSKSKIFIFLIMFSTIQANVAFAESIQNSKIAKGLEKMLNDLGSYLPVVAIPVGIVFTAYFFIRKGAADEMDQKKWATRIKVAIGCTIGAVVSGAIITVVSGYFK